MDQSGNNHLLLRASQSGPPSYNGQHAATDRMRELLARTVHDHIIEERSTAAALQDIRQRLDALDGACAIAATLDGLAATLGALDAKLTARLERLDERLDDQYDRVRSMDDKLESQWASTEETVARAVEAATAGITARIASLEDTVLTLAEALLRPARPLLPLDGAWRLARDVEHHAVDIADLVRDPGGDPREHLVGEPGPVGGHRVLARHRPDHDRVAVGPPVALHADGAHVGEQHHRALPDGLVEARGGQLRA